MATGTQPEQPLDNRNPISVQDYQRLLQHKQQVDKAVDVAHGDWKKQADIAAALANELVRLSSPKALASCKDTDQKVCSCLSQAVVGLDAPSLGRMLWVTAAAGADYQQISRSAERVPKS